jgi:hypothetical protein
MVVILALGTAPAQVLFPHHALAAAANKTFTYYVDPLAGSDKNRGTLAQPFKTVAKINALALTPGQSVGFKRGGVWREQLSVPSSGRAGNPITFGAYGTGTNPVITGADIATGFLDGGLNIWDKLGVTTQPNLVIIGGSLGTFKSSRAALASPGDWYWGSNQLSVYATSDPSGAVEMGQRAAAIYIQGKAYITVDGLTLSGGNQLGAFYASEGSTNLTIRNCTLTKAYFAGVFVRGVDYFDMHDSTLSDVAGGGTTEGDGILVYTNVVRNHNPSTNIALYQNTFTGYFARHCISYAGVALGAVHHNTITPTHIFSAVNVETDETDYINDRVSIYNNSIDVVNDLGGSAALTFGGTGVNQNISIHDNQLDLHNTASAAIGILTNAGTNTVYGNTIYNAQIGFKNYGGATTVTDNVFSGGSSGGTGLLLFNAAVTVAHHNIVSAFRTGARAVNTASLSMYHNTIYGFSDNGVFVDTFTPGPITVKNNIFSTNATGTAVFVRDSGGTPGSYDYNVYFAPNAYNYWYAAGLWYVTFANWKGAGHDGHSIDKDPLFANAAAGDFTLLPGSPAIGSGTYIPGITTTNPPNIGAK